MDFIGVLPNDKKRLKMMKALTDPLRLQLYNFLQEAHTVKEAAEALCVKNTTLYYHLRILQDADLIDVVGEKKVRNMTQKYYKCTKEVVLDRHAVPDPGPKAPFFEIIKNIAFTTYQDCYRELTTDEDKKAFASTFFVTMKKENLAHLPKEIAKASKEFEEKLKAMGDEDGDVRYSVTIIQFERSD